MNKNCSFSISTGPSNVYSGSTGPSNVYSGLISFRIDLFDLLGQTRDSQEALQHYSSKASILQPLAFFMVSLAPTSIHDFTTGKTIALTRQNFVGKVMSLLFNTLSRFFIAIHPVQFSSVTQLCPTLCYPMNCSTPGLPVHHQLPEFTQTHVHRVRDAIQPSHPQSSPFPPALNPSQHQSLFQ